MRPGPPGWPARWLRGLADDEAVAGPSTGRLPVGPSEDVSVGDAVGSQAAAPHFLAELAGGLCDSQGAGLASPVEVRGAVDETAGKGGAPPHPSPQGLPRLAVDSVEGHQGLARDGRF